MQNKNQVRIIGGKWRRRKIHFPDLPDLRPTHDRIRETLFNWLMPNIIDANCLDLFAGSGVIGFEAASRGAKSVVMIDYNTEVLQFLQQSKEALLADNIIIQRAQIPEANISFAFPFDIVFLDPPYHKNLIPVSIEWLIQNKLVRSGSLIYVEMENTADAINLPSGWKIIKNKHTTKINYGLILVD